MTRARWIRRGMLAVAALAALVFAIAAVAGFFDADPEQMFPAQGDGHRPLAAVLFSGDMGLRFGMGPHIAHALARQDVPVLGVSSPAAFAIDRTRDEVAAIVSDSIRSALERTGAERVLVVGQSFGADIARVGLAALPASLRGRVAGIVLVVPGRDAWFRADPSGMGYRELPDAGPDDGRALAFAPLLCIRGAAETDSLCPVLGGPNVRTVTLPGGHFLHNDHRLLVRTVLTGIAPVLVGAGRQP